MYFQTKKKHTLFFRKELITRVTAVHDFPKKNTTEAVVFETKDLVAVSYHSYQLSGNSTSTATGVTGEVINVQGRLCLFVFNCNFSNPDYIILWHPLFIGGGISRYPEKTIYKKRLHCTRLNKTWLRTVPTSNPSFTINYFLL